MFAFIAAAVDSENESPCYLFRGATLRVIREAFRHLVGSCDLIAMSAEINTRFVIRHGKSCEEISVLLADCNNLYPPGLIRELIELMIKREMKCEVAWMDIDEFLNINIKPKTKK